MTEPASRARVLLVRHGESTWNAEGRWQGQADPPLSVRGRDQARAAVAALERDHDQVVASDLVRARATAEILAGGLDLPSRLDARLRERHAGPWEGRTRDEIEARWPGMLDSGHRPDGYEPDEVLAARALEVLRDLDRPTVVVTHGGLIRAVGRLFGAAAGRIPNLAALPLEPDGGSWRAGAFVELVPSAATATEGAPRHGGQGRGAQPRRARGAVE